MTFGFCGVKGVQKSVYTVEAPKVYDEGAFAMHNVPQNFLEDWEHFSSASLLRLENPRNGDAVGRAGSLHWGISWHHHLCSYPVLLPFLQKTLGWLEAGSSSLRVWNGDSFHLEPGGHYCFSWK